MADKVFQAITGAQTWSNAANWNGASLPVDGDRVFIKSGDAALVITAGSTQAGIQLAQCQLWDTFKGSFDVDVQSAIWDIGYPSGSTNGNSGSGDVTITNGAQAGTINVFKTAASTNATSGEQALKFTGTATTNVINVFGTSTVDIGADLSATVVDDLNILAGDARVVVHANATTTDIKITGGTLIHHGLADASSTLLVSGGNVWTYGATKHTTITVNNSGTAYLNHRTSGDDTGTLTINTGGTVDLTGNPLNFQTTAAIVLNAGGKLRAFSFAQIEDYITFASPATISLSIP